MRSFQIRYASTIPRNPFKLQMPNVAALFLEKIEERKPEERYWLRRIFQASPRGLVNTAAHVIQVRGPMGVCTDNYDPGSESASLS